MASTQPATKKQIVIVVLQNRQKYVLKDLDFIYIKNYSFGLYCQYKRSIKSCSNYRRAAFMKRL